MGDGKAAGLMTRLLSVRIRPLLCFSVQVDSKSPVIISPFAIRVHLKGKDAVRAVFKFSLRRTEHPFHILDPSPWPFCLSVSVMFTIMGFVEYVHMFVLGFTFFVVGLIHLNLVLRR